MRALNSIFVGLAIGYLLLFAYSNHWFLPAPAQNTPLPAIFYLSEGGKRQWQPGRPGILHFWATWCGPCVKELPALANYTKKHPEIAVLALAENGEELEKVAAFLESHGAENLSPATDPGNLALRAVQARGLPTTIWVNAQGIIRLKHEGPVDWEKPPLP